MEKYYFRRMGRMDDIKLVKEAGAWSLFCRKCGRSMLKDGEAAESIGDWYCEKCRRIARVMPPFGKPEYIVGLLGYAVCFLAIAGSTIAYAYLIAIGVASSTKDYLFTIFFFVFTAFWILKIHPEAMKELGNPNELFRVYFAGEVSDK
ncbi:MAG: hypothetical protein ABIH99_02860 [Candidatus Micrarchaeota archaeon]